MPGIREGSILQVEPQKAMAANCGALLVVRQVERDGRAVAEAFYTGFARGNRATTVVVGTDAMPWDKVALVGELRWRSV